MIDKDLQKIKTKATELQSLVEKALDNYKREHFESKKIYNEFDQHFFQELCDMVNLIEYFEIEPKEYKLKLRNDGRYEVNDESHYFTSGSRIEVYIDDEIGWCIGRVECRYDNDRAIYYFLNYDDRNVDLYPGMKVRIRKD